MKTSALPLPLSRCWPPGALAVQARARDRYQNYDLANGLDNL
jgi:hypothetical protein